MCLKFGFIIFWQKDFGAKAAHKMLVKLTLGSKNFFSQLNLSRCFRTFLDHQHRVGVGVLRLLHDDAVHRVADDAGANVDAAWWQFYKTFLLRH